MIVPDYMLTMTAANGQIGQVAGSSGLALPLRDAANHAGGYLMDGMLFCSETGTPRSGTGRLMEYRYPNCAGLVFWIHVATVGSGAHQIVMTAGAGAATTYILPDFAPHSFWAYADWGASAGWQEVSWALTDCTIDGISIWSLARYDMAEADGDDCIERFDPTNLQGGLDESRVIMSDGAATYHVSGIAETLEEAQTASRPTAIQCSCMSNPQTMVGAGAGVWAAVGTIGPFWEHRAQTWRSGDPYQAYRCYVRASVSGGGSYWWRFRATAVPSTVTAGAFVDAVATWRVIDALQIDATADDTIYFEGAATAGDTLTVTDLTVKRYTP